ncbi:uncharacterized protein SPSK_01862 [Sporothrix schenckii 1099-18]|uniref:Uncharacterized protein n=2 Tax=Sporothrix schenckii TaxID=29908 RepID=U7PIK0_SPOS1|nr:uncharacterized protein SPSK_01862 [Sporothrix schenckii 1099-18]ERS95428.1 hypothetical protein HMPREF1624_08306 [Sporothrix schenckii ATCC 58251]KJR87436.1 hypothetical protein SPSK_01862 [Sporothrix schenckii 1099-18]
MERDTAVDIVVDVDIADTNYAIYREALAAVLINKLAVHEVRPKRKQRRRKAKKAEAKAGLETLAEAERDAAVDAEDDWEGIASPDQSTAAETLPKPQTLIPLHDNSNSNTDNATNPADDLAEFVDYVARETFDLLPAELRTLAHHVWTADAALRDKYGVAEDGSTSAGVPIPAALSPSRTTELLPTLDPSPVADSLDAYGVGTAAHVLAPALSSYLVAVTAAPPPPRSTRDQADGCEICGRDWINLSYHHLIPRFVHAKVLKRRWHRADELQNVAWLCGACHRQVHRFADHEDLARHYYTVERLLAEPEMQRYAAWASRLRWKAK